MNHAENLTAAHAYARTVTSGIDRALAAGALSLPSVMAYLPGVFPLVISEELRQRGVMSSPCSSTSNVTAPSQRGAQDTDFLLPHPLDYDWRFNLEALEKLDLNIRRVRPDQPEVFCFGCPSVAGFLRRRSWASTVRLFDSNGFLHEANTPTWRAESDGALGLGTGVVVADPPWYPTVFRQFLWTVRESCGVGTDVFLAGPSEGTRPGVRREMHRLLAWTRNVGFEIVSHEASALPYLMPLFELNTLKAHGLHDVPMDWRRADMWHLKLCTKPARRGPARGSTGAIWEERRFGAVRIRVRTDQVSRGSSTLQPLGVSGFLPSVSSRDPLRRKAAVVTSGGRFFSCTNPVSFLQASSILIAERSPRSEDSDSSKWNLARLVAVEQLEAASYYELVRKINCL